MNAALIELVDKIGPINNRIRSEKEPIKKIESMWELGEYLDNFIVVNNYKLHSLLYELYDPHSTFKNTNVTRDLASYCYRFYKFFRSKKEIQQKLEGLKSYKAFRDAFPLLSNPRYKLTEFQKEETYKLIKQNEPLEKLLERIETKKKSIIKISRVVKKKDFENEKEILLRVSRILDDAIQKNQGVSDILPKLEYSLSDLTNLVYCLMTLAYELPGKTETPNWKFESEELMPLMKISFGSTEDKARFRRWGLSTNELLKLAEKLQCVINNDMQYLISKYLNN